MGGKKLKLVKEEALDYIPSSIKDLSQDSKSQEKDNFKKFRGGKKPSFIPHQDFQILHNLKINKKEFEREIQGRVEERLIKIRKDSEDKGYQLGLKMGETKAFETFSKEIGESLQSLSSLIQEIREKESRIIFENKAQILKITFEIAKKIAMKEISENPESLLSLITKVFEQVESDSKIVFYLSKVDVDFIENLKSEIWEEIKKKDFKKVHLKASSKVNPGGCIVETNYTKIDASLETRFEEIWKNLSETLVRERKSFQGGTLKESSVDGDEGLKEEGKSLVGDEKALEEHQEETEDEGLEKNPSGGSEKDLEIEKKEEKKEEEGEEEKEEVEKEEAENKKEDQ